MNQPAHFQKTNTNPSAQLPEEQILEFVDVLARTSQVLVELAKNIPDEGGAFTLCRDAEILLELRARVWRQFVPVFVDVVN